MHFCIKKSGPLTFVDPIVSLWLVCRQFSATLIMYIAWNVRLQEMFLKKERELAKLEQDYMASIVTKGKLSSQQADWLSNEMMQKQQVARDIFTTALSKRLAAVRERKLNQKRLIESEVWKLIRTVFVAG